MSGRSWATMTGAAVLAAAAAAIVAPADVEAATRGRLVSAAYSNGMVFRISGENMSRATWTRRQTTTRGVVTGESGTATVGRRTYSYVASISWTNRSTATGRVTVGGGILSPKRQSVRF